MFIEFSFFLRWFRQLNRHYGVSGLSYFLYKPQGRNKTESVSADQALRALKKGLRSTDTTYIYHCQNHYFCPIGFEDVPLKAEHAYRYLDGHSIYMKNFMFSECYINILFGWGECVKIVFQAKHIHVQCFTWKVFNLFTSTKIIICFIIFILLSPGIAGRDFVNTSEG